MIKDSYFKESTIPDNDEALERKNKLRSKYFEFVNFDERKMLRSVRLGMYFR
tara:strand:+ start:1616 stop:1771 length:156 start_codon:yes stop_codon:yes gene_type:complete